MAELTEAELIRGVIDHLQEKTQGTGWAPENGGVIVDVLCVMITQDINGQYGSCWLSAGSAEQAEGMCRKVLRSLNQADTTIGVHRAMFLHGDEDDGSG